MVANADSTSSPTASRARRMVHAHPNPGPRLRHHPHALQVGCLSHSLPHTLSKLSRWNCIFVESTVQSYYIQSNQCWWRTAVQRYETIKWKLTYKVMIMFCIWTVFVKHERLPISANRTSLYSVHHPFPVKPLSYIHINSHVIFLAHTGSHITRYMWIRCYHSLTK